jgi:putative ABC transport system permease protein
MQSFDESLMKLLDNPYNLAGLALLLVLVALAFVYRGPVGFTLKFVLKSLKRNLLRTALTGLATVFLVFVITLIWSMLLFLGRATEEKSKDFKAIVTERWNIPSQMPPSYVRPLGEGAAAKPGDYKPEDYMSWSFYGGTSDPQKMTRESIVFFFCMQPEKVLTMMDGMDDFTAEQRVQIEEACKAMSHIKNKVVIGQDRLDALNKKVGERFTVTSMNYKGIDLEVEIIGALPRGRYGQSAIMNYQYLLDAMDAYKRSHGGQAHPMADRSLNLVWLKVPNTEAFNKVSNQIVESAEFKAPAVKCETASSGIASWLDAYRSLFWAMQWLLSPIILVTLSMVIAIAISISVIQRRNEMAILKVLGFSPTHILLLVIGEAVVIGAVAGFLSSGGTYGLARLMGGFPFQIAFFPTIGIPWQALWWGPLIGGVTGLLGSIVPALFAQSIKVAEVFSKTA